MMDSPPCPDCGRAGLKLLKPNDLVPRHKPAATAPEAADSNGWCRGSGRHAYDTSAGMRYGPTGL